MTMMNRSIRNNCDYDWRQNQLLKQQQQQKRSIMISRLPRSIVQRRNHPLFFLSSSSISLLPSMIRSSLILQQSGNSFTTTCCTTTGNDRMFTSQSLLSYRDNYYQHDHHYKRNYRHHPFSYLSQYHDDKMSHPDNNQFNRSKKSYHTTTLKTLSIGSYFSEIRQMVRSILHRDEHTDPKKILERQLLGYTLLVTLYHSKILQYTHNKEQEQQIQQIQQKIQNQSQEQYQNQNLSNPSMKNNNKNHNNNTTSNTTTTTTTTTTILSREEKEIVYQQVLNEISKEININDRKLYELRAYVQEQLQKQIQSLFTIFYHVDQYLHLHHDNDSYDDYNPVNNVLELFENDSELYKTILIQDYQVTCDEFHQLLYNDHDDERDSITTKKENTITDKIVVDDQQKQMLSFLYRKIRAMEILLSYHDWVGVPPNKKNDDESNGTNNDHNMNANVNELFTTQHHEQIQKYISSNLISWNHDLDPFGMKIDTTTTTTTTTNNNINENTDDQASKDADDDDSNNHKTTTAAQQSTLALIRHYQTINMCRSACIKKEMGYSILTLQSCIPNGGRGTFVDCTGTSSRNERGSTSTSSNNSGCCHAGSILVFQPGTVWPNEHLINAGPDIIQHFKNDDDCQISLRFDNYVVDSRNSPVTVLNQFGVDTTTITQSTTADDNDDDEDHVPSKPTKKATSLSTPSGFNNPWALGHMVNHPYTPPAPPKSERDDVQQLKPQQPNAISSMMNYTVPLKGGSNNNIHGDHETNMITYLLNRYIPNQYAYEPGWKTQMLYNYDNNVLMHGMCLIATKEMKNIEIVYDYKLQQDPIDYPSWYQPVQYEKGSYFAHDNNNNDDDVDTDDDTKSTKKG